MILSVISGSQANAARGRFATWASRVDDGRLHVPCSDTADPHAGRSSGNACRHGAVPQQAFPRRLGYKALQIAEVDGAVVGFVGWKGCEVLALYVAQAWRGHRMVGTLLLAAAERAIAGKGYAQVRVMIDADADGAHRFYKRANYETEPMDHDAEVAWMIKRL